MCSDFTNLCNIHVCDIFNIFNIFNILQLVILLLSTRTVQINHSKDSFKCRSCSIMPSCADFSFQSLRGLSYVFLRLSPVSSFCVSYLRKHICVYQHLTITLRPIRFVTTNPFQKVAQVCNLENDSNFYTYFTSLVLKRNCLFLSHLGGVTGEGSLGGRVDQ